MLKTYLESIQPCAKAPVTHKPGFDAHHDTGIMFHKSDKFGELTQMHKEMVIPTGLSKANRLQSCMMVERVMIRCLTSVQIR